MNTASGRRARFAALGIALVAVLTVPGAAVTATPTTVTMCDSQWTALGSHPSLDTARGVGLCEIDRRLADLKTLRGKAKSAVTLTSADRSAIEGKIDASRSGLQRLRGQVAADSAIATLNPDLHSIVFSYRVYVVVVRQSWLAYAADSELAAVKQFKAFDTKLGQWIAAADAAGFDTTGIAADQAAMDKDISQVRSAATPASAEVLALTPAGYNEGSAGPAMDRATATLATAASLLADARLHAQTAVTQIEALANP